MKVNLKVVGSLALAGLMIGNIIGWGQQTASSSDPLSSVNITLPSGEVQALALTAADMPALKQLTDAQLSALINALDATPTIPYTALPRNGMAGTYFSLEHPDYPPLPGDINQADVWPMDGFYILNDVSVHSAEKRGRERAVRSTAGITAMISGPPSPGGGGTNTVNYATSTNTFDHTKLWLEITNISSGVLPLNLHHATNQVYAIWSTTNLLTAWNVVTELWPTNGTVMPFTAQSLIQPNLFLRAEDWTAVDSNGDGIPDWWIWSYFGNLSETATNLDSQGVNTLLYDYQHGIDPNIISFTASATNQYVNASGAPLQLSVTAGTPSYFAMLLDDTNHAHASWTAYTSSQITAGLGTIQGWHQVYVGLRGLPSNAYQTWQSISLKLDLNPPLLVLTNIAPGTVTRPIIQLQGYSPEALAGISYDLTNATGLMTNQQVLIMGQYYATNTLELTTNYFQCFDVPLTNGLNTVTFHATDLAGNLTTTNFTFNYLLPTNPPTVQLGWPVAGTKISGSSFTMRGQVSDPTAQVTAQIVATNGVTNSVTARVGRSGDFWVLNLPLSGGTNHLWLFATNSTGLTSVTNIPVVQSSLILTVNPPSIAQQIITGTINSTNYTVWVNGVKGTNNLDGTWTVQLPPLNFNTPVVQVRAIPNSDHGGNGGGQ